MITLTLEPEEFEYLLEALYSDRDVLKSDARIDSERTDGMQLGEAHFRWLRDLNDRVLDKMDLAEREARGGF